PEDRNRLAAARLDQADRDADQGLGRRAAADHVHVEIEADAEIAGDEGRRGRVAAGIVEHAVDVGGFQPGIEDRVPDRPSAERPRRLVRAAGVGGLAHPDDRVFVAQVFRGRRVDLLWWQWHRRFSWFFGRGTPLSLNPRVPVPRRLYARSLDRHDRISGLYDVIIPMRIT